MSDIDDVTQNVTIWDNAKGKNVSVITDGLLERLAVDANIEGDVSATKYTLKFDHDETGTTVTTTDTSIYSFTGEGIIDFIALTAGSSSYEVIVKVDGIEELRITMGQLGSDLALTDGNSPIWATVANKQFRFRPQSGEGFTTSFEVLARATTGTVDIKHLVTYREYIG